MWNCKQLGDEFFTNKTHTDDCDIENSHRLIESRFGWESGIYSEFASAQAESIYYV
jgi:hypothetical protein